MLYGFSQVILQGALVTLELALSSVVLAVLIGLAGAGAKLSSNRPLALVFEGYTTLIRGVPDLVLMLLIFYGLQIALNSVTDALGMAQFDIDPMIAGIITLGFIYGAYFTETFRGAYLAVPKGHIEAATAFGFSGGQTFRRILFPAMMRYALPGIGNNWQVILKATALVSLLGLEGLAARWRANLIEGAIAAEDRMDLARLEWADLKQRIQQLLVLTILVAGLTVVALIMVSLAVLVHFWDSPQRTLVAWLVAGVWAVGWAAATVSLVSVAQRAGSGFALTRRELAQDWRDIKERL